MKPNFIRNMLYHLLLEEFVNHPLAARGLRILRVFYQHPKWFINLYSAARTCTAFLRHFLQKLKHAQACFTCHNFKLKVPKITYLETERLCWPLLCVKPLVKSYYGQINACCFFGPHLRAIAICI